MRAGSETPLPARPLWPAGDGRNRHEELSARLLRWQPAQTISRRRRTIARDGVSGVLVCA
jgi:hypothetical protein